MKLPVEEKQKNKAWRKMIAVAKKKGALIIEEVFNKNQFKIQHEEKHQSPGTI